MATNKTLQPTNVTIQIPAMTDAPDQSVNSNCIDKLGDAVNTLNSKIVLPNPTGISSLDDLKNHLLAIHNSIANNGVAPSHIDVSSSYSGGFFSAGARYMGTYKRSTANQGVIEYSSPLNGDTVGVGLYSISTTPSLNVFSPYRQLYPYNLSNTADALKTYTLNDTTSHNDTVTATHDGFFVVRLASDASALEIFVRASMKGVGYSNTYNIPAYYAEPIISIPCHVGEILALSYKKQTGNNNATLVVQNNY